MNNVNLTGRITKDPELHETEKMQVVNFTLAVNREFSKEKEADFIPCVAYNNSATFMSNYIRKGDMIEVQGRIQIRNYQSKNGETIYVTEVVSSRVGLLAKNHPQVSSNPQPRTITHTHTTEEIITVPDNIADDDLPF